MFIYHPNYALMKYIFFFLVLAFMALNLQAQSGREVAGSLKDSTGQSVIAASVRLTSPLDSLNTLTDVNGSFKFRNVKSRQFTISASSLGFKAFSRSYSFDNASSNVTLKPLVMQEQRTVLNEVVVSGATPITVKEDTVEFRAKDYAVRENSVVEDVIKKLPGVEVDKDGNVSTQGKSITRVRVNGKDFFDGDLKTATQNLPAEVIEKIQIIDDYGDKARLSGVRQGEADKVLNITISPKNNKGVIANATSGMGTTDRYALAGMAQYMNNNEQISGLFNLNNTNASLFDFTGGGGRRGGGGRAGGGGGFGGGITNTRAAGLNYRNQLGKKATVYGSYSTEYRDNKLNSYSETQTVTSMQDLFTVNNRNSATNTLEHRFNANMEYTIDTLHYLSLSPSINFSGSDGNALGLTSITERSRQDQNSVSSSNSESPSYGLDMLFNKRFLKQGRNLSLSLGINKSNTSNDQDALDDFRYYSMDDMDVFRDSSSHRLINTYNKRFNTEAELTYSEPLGKLSRLDFRYNFNRTSYDNSRITELEMQGGQYRVIDSLSNIFDYSFMTNRFGLSYRYDRPKLFNFSVGLSAQPSLLKGYSQSNKVDVERKAFNFFPNARFSYSFARSRSLNIDYSGRSDEPGYNQIQPVTDLSNPQRPVIGNPNLKSAFNQSINVRYNNFVPEDGSFFNVGLRGNISKDRIISNVVRVRTPVISGADTTFRLIQEVYYLNANGYYDVNGYYAWSRPFADKKFTLRLFGMAGYTNDVSYADNLKNTGRNWNLRQFVRMGINPNDNIDINPSIGYRRGWVNYSLPNRLDSKNSTWSFGLDTRIYFLKTFLIGLDASKDINSGFGRSVTSNPLIMNAYLEKQFFSRRGRLRLQGYDLLNERTNINVSQGTNSNTFSRTNSLNRYFMMTFSYRLSRFAGKNLSDSEFENNNRRGRRGMGGGSGRAR